MYKTWMSSMFKLTLAVHISSTAGATGFLRVEISNSYKATNRKVGGSISGKIVTQSSNAAIGV